MPVLPLALLMTAAVTAPPNGDGEPGEDALPVVELTAFKDGHALVIREGVLPVTNGTARVAGLPEPLFGTFWPSVNSDGAKLASATAGYQTVAVERTPLTPEELLTAAVGSRILVHQYRGEDAELTTYEATILARPTRSPEERRRAGEDSDTGQPLLPQRGPTLLLKTDAGVRAVPIGSITEFTLLGGEGAVPDAIEDYAVRTGLTLRVVPDGGGDVPAEVTAGLSYVQPGFQWVPQYRVTLGDDGEAQVALQAALVNDLIDLTAARVNLVVGVPSFAFEGQTDPISLQVAYEAAMKMGRGRQNLSNAVPMYSRGGLGGGGGGLGGGSAFGGGAEMMMEDAPAAPPPAVGDGARNEDLFVYPVSDVTLARGERMTVRVKNFSVPYEDKYAALFPAVPPRELIRSPNQQEQLAKLLTEGAVTHSIVLTNDADVPFTTAPALLYRAGEDGANAILAQGRMTYAAPGGESEIDLGTAVEVSTDLSETVTGRQPQPTPRGTQSTERVNLAGEIEVTNRRPEATTVTLTRLVPGVVDEVGGEGTSRELGPADLAKLPPGASVLSDYGVPNWWVSLNPLSRIEWEVTVQPGETKTVTYGWHYFWRQ